jgi:uncharacterized protein
MPQEWVLYLLLLTAMVISLFLTILQLPGLWLILAFCAGYAWATGGAYIGVWTLVILLALAAVGEVLETLAAAAGAKKAGATKTGMLLAIVGAFVGGVVFTVLTVPVLGTLIGVCVGAFFGGFAGDVLRGRRQDQAVRSGIGAAIGRVFGTIIKVSFGVAMLLVASFMAIPADPLTGQAVPPGPPIPLEVQRDEPVELELPDPPPVELERSEPR